jgi:hypothetical protein
MKVVDKTGKKCSFKLILEKWVVKILSVNEVKIWQIQQIPIQIYVSVCIYI